MSVCVSIIVALILLFCFTAFTGAPFVPSKKRDLKKLFNSGYQLTKKDTVIDLGAGSGTVMHMSISHGAKVIGLELNPVLAIITKLRFLRQPRATVKCCNFYNYKFPPATTVVYAFADSRDIKKIYDKVRRESARLNKPLTLISYAFKLPDIKPTQKSGPFFIYKLKSPVVGSSEISSKH